MDEQSPSYFGEVIGGESGSWEAGLNFLNGVTGESFETYDEFVKALTANTGTTAGGPDISQLTGGAALRLQSIEKTYKASIPLDKHFKFLNSLASERMGATIHEYTTFEAIGGHEGSAFVGEMDDIPEYTETLKRKWAEVKFLMTMRMVSFVQTQQKTMADTIALAKIGAVRQLKQSVEWALFYGDKAVNPAEFDGAITQILAENNPDLIKDARGKGLSFGATEMLSIAGAIGDFENFGLATHVYTSRQVARDELNAKLNPALRLGLGGSTKNRDVEVGTVVTGIRTQDDEALKVMPDHFLREGNPPFEARGGRYPGIVTAAAIEAPGGISVAASANAASQWAAEHAGLFYWGVASIKAGTPSALVKSTQVTVAAGDRAVVTITNPTDTGVTGFWLFRGRKNGTNATGDFREMIRIPRQAGASTVYNDDNQRIPGTSIVLITNQSPEGDAIGLRRLFPLVMFPLATVRKATRQWGQLFSGVLILFKPRQHGVILNVLPDNATWKPFN